MNIALLTAGGSGNRMGQDIPKQFICIASKPVIIYTLEAFQQCPQIDAIAVVCLKGWEVTLQAYANQFNITKLRWIFPGGDTNYTSIRNGLEGLRREGCQDDDLVLVHDAVRPLVSRRIIDDNIRVARESGYAVTGIMCKEVILESTGDYMQGMDIPRERVIRTQTPQTYALGTLLQAYHEAYERGLTAAVAPCNLLALLGCTRQKYVQGEERNMKLTTPEDVELFKALIYVAPETWMKTIG